MEERQAGLAVSLEKPTEEEEACLARVSFATSHFFGIDHVCRTSAPLPLVLSGRCVYALEAVALQVVWAGIAYAEEDTAAPQLLVDCSKVQPRQLDHAFGSRASVVAGVRPVERQAQSCCESSLASAHTLIVCCRSVPPHVVLVETVRFGTSHQNPRKRGLELHVLLCPAQYCFLCPVSDPILFGTDPCTAAASICPGHTAQSTHTPSLGNSCRNLQMMKLQGAFGMHFRRHRTLNNNNRRVPDHDS